MLINGIGALVGKTLVYETDAINYEKMSGTNNHNENGVVVEQGHDAIFDDDTTVWFSCTDKYCSLTVAVNSEVAVPLYRDGYARLTYDRATEQWSMRGYQDNSKEWQFCSPQSAFDHVVSILTYLSLDDEKDVWIDSKGADSANSLANNYLIVITESIRMSRAPVFQSAALYTGRADCSAPPISQQTTPYDGDRSSAIIDI